MYRVAVHWNFHKHLFSVVKGGRVVEHADLVQMRDVRFCVGPRGRERVLREQVKNVHARIRGLHMTGGRGWGSATEPSVRGWTRVGYDPYRWASFVSLRDERPVRGAHGVVARVRDGKAQVYALGVEYA